MKFDPRFATMWRATVDQALPQLLHEVASTKGRGLILGASVLQIYQQQGWINRARATGDLDLSVGIVADTTEYEALKRTLVRHGYEATDPERAFRLFSPVRLGLSIAYVDLLAHPETTTVTPREARLAMGVGESWTFEEIAFALERAFEIAPNVYVPNPIGFLALKRASYHDDPRRIRDLVDIVDVVFDMVGKALHYDLTEIWTAMSQVMPAEADKVKGMIRGVVDEAVEWDFRRAEQDFAGRGYKLDELEARAPSMFRELLDVLP